ncbi:manganese efflux pump MntP family protein [Clostridium hydrogeniformans]|uniref:manganese efflux pump MntP n=1 Tax=Clostridium hydrogeniformans TaxID=349933 RepID=UPI000480C7AC|nr:manganese efflux pump MntP family protein [Clostridium hydrogeniformans]
MSILSILLIAVGLSMDAFAVAVTKGMTITDIRLKDNLKIALCFGLAQGIMPIIGWILGVGFKDYITSLDHWIALILLSVLGIKMIYEAVKSKKEETIEEECVQVLNNKEIVILAIATSIDALAVGISFAFLDMSIIASSCIIAIVTFIICSIGVIIGKKFGDLVSSKAEIIGGFILIIIGVRIFIEHTNIL